MTMVKDNATTERQKLEEMNSFKDKESVLLG